MSHTLNAGAGRLFASYDDLVAVVDEDGKFLRLTSEFDKAPDNLDAMTKYTDANNNTVRAMLQAAGRSAALTMGVDDVAAPEMVSAAPAASELRHGHKKSWSELFPALSERKYRYIDSKGEVAHLSKTVMPSYLQPDKDGTEMFGEEIGACGIPKGSRTWKLRTQLMDQLNKLVVEGNCFGECKEDEALDKMEKRYLKYFKGEGDNCALSKFSDDDRLKLLAAKKAMLQHQSFAFLHSECEGDAECNPFGKDNIMPKELIECSGIREGGLLFGDESMAAVGKFLSGSQKAGESPAALGHASNLYQTGLIAPGVDKSKLWINICYLVARSDLDANEAGIARGKEGNELAGEHAYFDTKWVAANVLEQKKYVTMKGVEHAITERKRAILKVNRQILELQMQMSNVHGTGNFFSGEDTDSEDSNFNSSTKGLTMYVQNSVSRAKNMLLSSEARRKMREDTQGFRFQVAHGKKGVAHATEKALGKLILGGKKKKKKRNHSRRRRSSRR
jgi:hypothetical protein